MHCSGPAVPPPPRLWTGWPARPRRSFSAVFVFFDIDGTLLDQRGAERAAADVFFRRYGHLLRPPCGPARFCHLWRSVRERHLPAYLSGAISYRQYHHRRIRDLFPDGASLAERELDTRYEVFHSSYRRGWRLFEDVRPALDRLQKRCPLGIISNGNARHQRCKLRSMGILDRFRVVVISEEVSVGKPGRAIFAEACRRAGVAASRCVCVGDSIDHDVRPSLAIGMRGVWLNRGGEHPTHPLETIRSLSELSNWPESGCGNHVDPDPVILGGPTGRECCSG